MVRPSGIQTEMFASNIKHRTGENGNNILENLRVFKVGTFTDMFGFEHTWDDLHLDQMVQHFHFLKDADYFPHVPIRAGHTMSIKDVIGYYEDIYRDPDDPQFLSATVEFTEPDAWEKWERGTWRSRSIEIGMYETNDGRSFWPVVMGLAFVDIPAVEGLHGRPNNPKFSFSTYVTDTEENNLFPDINTDPEGWARAVNADPEGFNRAAAYARWIDCANYAQACQNWVDAVNYAHALEQEQARQTGNGTTDATQPSITPPVNPPAPTPPVPTPPAPHSAPTPQVMQFRVNGQQTSDFAAIQSHIDMLEGYRAESIEMGRRSFVQELAQNNQILATQIEGLTNHALSLTDEQFASFRQMYENAPVMPGFGHQGHQSGETSLPNPAVANHSGQGQPQGDIELAKEIVSQHRKSGMNEEKVKATPSYQKLVAAGISI